MLVLPAAGTARDRGHMTATLEDLARRIATLLGYDFDGEHPSTPLPHRKRYFVPVETLMAGDALALGISGEHDLFGGVVPHAFLATKTISHPVVDSDASVPDGWSHEVCEAMGDAIRYDAAVGRAYPDFFASRRNYDVAAGYDASGARRCGVLEQSWRIGGASPAELAAVAAFQADPSLRRVRASCHERYTDEPPPAGATVHYRGDDGEVGMLCKYSLVEEEHRA